ncbi:MAG: hypothetical protein LBT23_05335 [Synergistaceae bacterium]|jgi:hypothetical protein|nr:hypothetical protein [Synergistaceae bacterium]
MTRRRVKKITRAALFAAVVVFILIGLFQGEIKSVFQKGASICLECVGIG